MNFFDQFFLGNPVSTWLIFIGIIVGSTILGWLATRMIKLIGKRSNQQFLSEFAPKLASFGGTIFLLFGLRIALNILQLPDGLIDFLSKAISFSISLVIIIIVLRLYDTLHNVVLMPYAKRTETHLDNHLLGILRLVVRMLIIVLGILIGLSNAGFDVGAALAGLGIGGLAFALAAQDAVSNLFGGTMVLIERPFQVGDQIEINKMRGFVREIGLRTTLLESRFGRMIRLPNKVFTSSPVELITHTLTMYRVINRIQIKYNTPVAKIEKAMESIIAVVKDQELVNHKRCAFEGFGDYGYKLIFVYDVLKWTIEQQEQFAKPRLKADVATSAINLEIVKAFEQENIEIALPIREEVQINAGDYYSNSSEQIINQQKSE